MGHWEEEEMKRSPLKRKTPLASDPEKTRLWQRNSRSSLSPGEPKKREPIPRGVRSAVRSRSGGWCVACMAHEGMYGGVLPRVLRQRVRWLAGRGDIRRIAHLHHVLPVQTYPEYQIEQANLVGVCAECHDEHERARMRIPLEALPAETRDFIRVVGDPMALYIENTYPALLYPEGLE